MQYKENIKTIGELKSGDKVLGTDGEWHDIIVLPIQYKMTYIFQTNINQVCCSYDHQWNIYDKEKFIGTFSTIDVKEKFIGMNVSIPNGPIIEEKKKKKKELCRCIEVNNHDNQFEIMAFDNSNGKLENYYEEKEIIPNPLNLNKDVLNKLNEYGIKIVNFDDVIK